MTFKEKLIGILDGSYNLTPAEVNLENKLWERYVDLDTENRFYKEESLEAMKEYQRNYHREYYRRKLAKGKWSADRAYIPRTESSASRSQNKRQYDYRNKMCNYLGEEIKFGTLIHRLFKVYGNWPEATAKAKLYLINTEENNSGKAE